MLKLYANPAYKAHLAQRRNKQTIMLGFSDGTKDGGYIMASWSIYKAKEMLSEVSRVVRYRCRPFFDGRGGPPARGGGNTHQFYAYFLRGCKINANDIQITVQGQTISSNFGTEDSAPDGT